jgi:hypothetical protein
MICIVEMCEVSPKMKRQEELPVSSFWSHLSLDLYCV